MGGTSARVGRGVDKWGLWDDARLPEGSGGKAFPPPVALDGPLLTIRRFPQRALTVARLVAAGSLTPGQDDLLEQAVGGRLNVLVSGGPRTGNTTLPNLVAAFIRPRPRDVTRGAAAEPRP